MGAVVNQNVMEKLDAYRSVLMANHAAGAAASSASKGRDREAFVHDFLSDCFPPSYRFGSGEVTNSNGVMSGQLDIVVEYPFAPSLTMSSNKTRLYFEESVAVVIEVKSDLSSQWQEVQQTAARLRALNRPQRSAASFGGANTNLAFGTIPIFAVGYGGWSTLKTVQEKANSGVVDGVLVLEHSLFAASDRFQNHYAQGSVSLFVFLSEIHECLRAVAGTGLDLLAYAR